MNNLSSTQCAIENCKTTVLNKPTNVTFHPFPRTNEMRSVWLKVLKNRCSVLDLSNSRICSKHFELKCFDSHRRLKESAIPTLFALSPSASASKVAKLDTRNKIDVLLNRLTQAELTSNIKNSMLRMKEPSNLESYVTNDLKCKPDAPKEAHLWLMVKKQEHLNNRLRELVFQTNKHVERLEANLDEAKNTKKEQEQNVESLKYIVKCLQEKHATLEEQIEILTAVESR